MNAGDPAANAPCAVSGDEHIEQRIVDVWLRNGEPWTAAVRGQRIESRRLVTDRAIVECVLSGAPRRVLDIGCGEGWLARELAGHGIEVDGVDVAPDLVAQARAAGGGRFEVMSYASIAAGAISDRYDACVCNFSLLGDRPVRQLVGAVPALLAPRGVLIVQTLHPLVACADQPYRDGWREGSWAGIDGAFGEPAPWYFRTLETWVDVYARAGLHVLALHEPLHPSTARPASLIVVGGTVDAARGSA